MKLLQLLVTLSFTITISYAISLPIFFLMNVELPLKTFLSLYLVLICFNLLILYVGKLKRKVI